MLRSRKQRNENLKKDPTCRACGVTKKYSDFPTCAVDYACNVCRNEYAKRRQKEKREAMTDAEYKAHRERLNRKQKVNREARLSKMTEAELKAYKDKINAGNLERREKVRHEVYMAYGGYVCSCCGETEKSFLSIDHVNNDGAEHRRSENLQTGEQLYRWLRRNKYPEGFQVLCMNCNWGKRMNGGVCPHEAQKV